MTNLNGALSIAVFELPSGQPSTYAFAYVLTASPFARLCEMMLFGIVRFVALHVHAGIGAVRGDVVGDRIELEPILTADVAPSFAPPTIESVAPL